MIWINDIVDGIIDMYNTNSPYELCRYLNIRIQKLEKNSYLLNGNDSIYYRNYYGHEIIFIRNDLYGYDEEFKNRSLRSFVVVNKAKQGKAQVTLCFKCEISASSKIRNVVKRATPVFIEEILCDGPGRFPSHELYLLVGR